MQTTACMAARIASRRSSEWAGAVSGDDRMAAFTSVGWICKFASAAVDDAQADEDEDSARVAGGCRANEEYFKVGRRDGEWRSRVDVRLGDVSGSSLT